MRPTMTGGLSGSRGRADRSRITLGVHGTSRPAKLLCTRVSLIRQRHPMLPGPSSGHDLAAGRQASRRLSSLILREIVSHAVWLYHRSTPSFRDVDDLLAERGVVVYCDAVRLWSRAFFMRLIARSWRSLRSAMRLPVSRIKPEVTLPNRGVPGVSPV